MPILAILFIVLCSVGSKKLLGKDEAHRSSVSCCGICFHSDPRTNQLHAQGAAGACVTWCSSPLIRHPFHIILFPKKKLMVNGHAHSQMSMFNLLHKMIISQLYSQQFHIIISDTIITIPQRPQYIRNELFHNRSSRRNLKGFIIEPALVDGGDEQLISLRHHCDVIVVAGGETPACVWHLTGLYSDDYENSSSITSLEEKEKPPLIIKDPIENTSVKNIK